MAQNPLAAYLAPYCGKQGKLKTALGDAGLRSLWALCDGSPTEMGEFLAYADGCSQMTLECERLGLPVQKRNWANMNEAGFEGGLTVNDWRALYRKETSKKEKVKDWEWILPRGTEYGTLIGLSDLHLGPKEMDYARWEKLRDWIAATPSVRWIGLGDFLDVATVQSPTGAQILPYQAAKDVLRADLAPIASQCFGVLGGNHEARIVRATKCQENPMAGVAKDLGDDVSTVAKDARK